MKKLTQNEIDEIKQIDLREISYKFGVTFHNNKALCPFHKEKTASLIWNDTDKYFKCFGCGESGDIISFVQKIKNIDFLEACEILSGKTLRYNGVDYAKRHSTEEIIRDIKNRYKQNLKDNPKVIEWIKQKYGFSDKTIDKENIGFSFSGYSLFDDLKKKYSTGDILSTGLFFQNGKEIYNNRIVFWITPFYSTGRYCDLFPDTEEAKRKYYNQLRNNKKFDYVSSFIKKEYDIKDLHNKSEKIYITEGPTDAISIRQTGNNAVCVGGITSIKNKDFKDFLFQAEKKGYTAVLSFDSDWVKKEGELFETDKHEKLKVDALFYLSPIIESQLILLPKFKNSEKTDICEYLKRGGNLEKIERQDIFLHLKTDYDCIEKIWKLRYNKKLYRKVIEHLKKKEDYEYFIDNFRTYLLSKGKKYNLPYGYAIIDDKTINVSALDESYIEEGFFLNHKNIVSNQPIWISAKVKNIDDDSEGIEISYVFDGELRTLITRRDVIETSSYKNLLNKGIKISPKTKNNLAFYFDFFDERYLPLKLVSNRLGWTNTKQPSYMLNDCIGDDIHLQDDKHYPELDSYGKFEEWKNALNNEVLTNTGISLAIGASISSSILKFINVPNFVLHLSGDSGTGKTTAIRIASSLFGNPSYGLGSNHSFIRSWNGTLNSLASIATTFTDLPFFLDELTNARMEATQLIYDYVNGTERTRLNKHSELRDIKTYRGVLISTGENPIISDEDTARKGELVRVINYNISDAFKVTPKGIDKVKFIKNLESVIRDNYGEAIKIFITKLIKNLDNDKNYITDKYVNIYKDLIERFGDIHNRKLQSYATILTSIELFIELLGFNKVSYAEIKKNIIEFIKIDLDAQETQESEEEKVIDYLKQVITSNRDKFPNRDGDLESYRDIWGTIEYKEKQGEYGNMVLLPSKVYIISSSLKKMIQDTKWTVSTVKKKVKPYCELDGKGNHQRKIYIIKSSYQVPGYILDFDSYSLNINNEDKPSENNNKPSINDFVSFKKVDDNDSKTVKKVKKSYNRYT